MKNRNTRETSRTMYHNRHRRRRPQQSAGWLERGPLDGATEGERAESLKLRRCSGIGNAQKAGAGRTPKTGGLLEVYVSVSYNSRFHSYLMQPFPTERGDIVSGEMS